MPELIILGTASAIPNDRQDNTHMILVGSSRQVLIDTSTNPIVRLRQAGIDPLKVTDLILTHFHPDHVSGVPLFLLDSWLLGRSQPLNVYGLTYTLERIETIMNLYDWKKWPNFFPVNFFNLPEQPLTPVLDCPEFRIIASPVHHMIPNIGVRIEFLQENKVLAYSCDTEPSQEVVKLAVGADILIHEATGALRGHTSAAQAGTIASQAEAGKLLLIHYELDGDDPYQIVEQAQTTYNGAVELALDFMRLNFK